jgi:hypothetical protein
MNPSVEKTRSIKVITPLPWQNAIHSVDPHVSRLAPGTPEQQVSSRIVVSCPSYLAEVTPFAGSIGKPALSHLMKNGRT